MMKKLIVAKINLIVMLLALSNAVQAQIPTSPNCPPSSPGTFQIVGADSSNCGEPITLFATPGAVTTTTTYSVQSVPYNPYPFVGANQAMTLSNSGAIVPLATIDDDWSFPVHLPFTFCFFGNQYDSVFIGSNGNLSFNFGVHSPGSNNQFNFGSGTTLPFPNNTANNSIMGPHSDIHPQSGTGCSITWQVYGTAPCRAFVVSWDSVPYFNANSTCGAFRTTQQTVLYEGTNYIDVIIKKKQLCLANTSNNAEAHQGIQNANGTVAYTVPGHNGGQWADSNSQWRFVPTGSATTGITWYNLNTGAVVGTGTSLTVAPTTNTTYAAILDWCPNTVKVGDTHTVYMKDDLAADFTVDVNLGCVDDTVVVDNTSTGVADYLWNFGDGFTSIAAEPGEHIYVNQGIYTISLIASKNAGQCKDTATKVVDLRHPLDANIVVDTTLCLYPAGGINATAAVANFSIGGGIVTTFDFGDGTVVVHTNTSVVPVHNYTAPGIYTLTVSIKDTLGCVDTTRARIYVEGIPFAYASASDNSLCVGEAIQFNDSIADMAASWTWSFPGGFKINNLHDPVYTFTTPGTYTVNLQVNFLYCPNLTVNIPVTVGEVPAVNLGPDTSYCDGFSSPIVLPTSSTITTGTLTWNTGAVSPTLAVNKPGLYWAEANTPQGCKGSDTILVRNDCFINIPNAFTPGSSDPLNSTFMPTANLLSGATAFSMDIYNRWGELVFTTKNIQSTGWDGKLGGKDQPMGVYVYDIKVTFKNGQRKNYTGNVTLIR